MRAKPIPRAWHPTRARWHPLNYYEHHLGDYAEATAHLSFVEDAAYARCIRKYYATETALPADLRAVQRLIGARTDEERQAVETILKEFFVLEADGWHNKRCDLEISRYRDKQAKARRSADARWDAHRTQCELDAKASTSDANASKTDAKAMLSSLQSPVSIHQSKESKKEDPQTPSDADQVFEHWKAVWKHPHANFDLTRRKRIECRLKDFTADQLCQAISGFRNSPWHCGTAPNSDGTVYDGIETLLRDTEQVETGLRLMANPPRAPPKPENAMDRIRRLNGGSDDSRVIEHEPDKFPAISSW